MTQGSSWLLAAAAAVAGAALLAAVLRMAPVLMLLKVYSAASNRTWCPQTQLLLTVLPSPEPHLRKDVAVGCQRERSTDEAHLLLASKTAVTAFRYASCRYTL